MLDSGEGARAFDSFRALDDDGDTQERDQLFRNMAQLFSYVSDKCDDEQVEQYDEVLCQLAELVEVEARSHVAGVLAPLDRAPGTVVVKLANDDIDVARPLLEFSNVLSDDDLISIVSGQTEDHRSIIAGRDAVAERVGDAIVVHGEGDSLSTLAQNQSAELGSSALAGLVEKAANNGTIADNLRGRANVDWKSLHGKISKAGQSVLSRLSMATGSTDDGSIDHASAVAYNRLRNKAGFKAGEWKIAWNQVKALSDRRQLNDRAMCRFGRFGYGHHFGVAITILLGLKQEVFVKWLADQDYLAVTVASKTLGLNADLFEQAFRILPWRDMPQDEDIMNVRARFESLDRDEAKGIFALWRSHAFRKRATPKPEDTALSA